MNNNNIQMTSSIIPDVYMKQLFANHLEQAPVQGTDDEIDFTPVVKLFCITNDSTWLITEIDEYRIMFGMCDLGMGFPELGYVSLDELENLNKTMPIPLIHTDLEFKAIAPLSKYSSVSTDSLSDAIKSIHKLK